MQRLLFVVPLIFFHITLIAQSNIDVLHYKFEIELSDKSDTISGIATIDVKFLSASDSISLDLAGPKQPGSKGMLIYTQHDTDHPYIAIVRGDKVILDLSDTAKAGEERRFIIHYFGIPSDGLIISRNKYGKRTFFSDNWPDRAHHWIPCVDDPSDKASVEFIITAPDHYEVVSNGLLAEERKLPDSRKLTHWKEETPLPTKIMVIGVADFAVDTAGYVHDIPVTSWVFPENKKAGFYDYAQAKNVLAWFVDYIGPFPYKKLANVQSKTMFGGMENAGAIFYNESTVTGTRSEERLLAHEITHQWFGDMVTEKNFSHLWLSEGFATYLANVYLESIHGADRFNKEMKEDKEQVIDFARSSDQPVVDTFSPYMQLLNANSYQKGGWILHMLRRQLGDSIFHAIIRAYYTGYAGKNADTKDFQMICEQVSGKNLETFFHQWLYLPGIPQVEIKWRYDSKKKMVVLAVDQLQKHVFDFPLEIAIEIAGKTKTQQLLINKRSGQFSIPVKTSPVRVTADPGSSLLFESQVIKIR
ncbi:MAG: M1 family metallopeptidase [Chitinophagaceae bacterium]|nr:M1 family metallopeptidase [Chitinophagaceae bacterium]